MVPNDALDIRLQTMEKTLHGLLKRLTNSSSFDMGTKEEVKPNFRTPPR
jgi:hypothetical protein